jgi:hypothetical protein
MILMILLETVILSLVENSLASLSHGSKTLKLITASYDSMPLLEDYLL